MLNIVFIISVTQNKSMKNLNHFQRVYFLSRQTRLTVISLKTSDFSASADPNTTIIRAFLPGKMGLLFASILWFFTEGRHGVDIVLTEPTIIGVAGFLGKFIGRCKWVVDVWDIPIRYNSATGFITRIRCYLTRRLMAFIYRWADLFLVSILPDYQLKKFSLSPEKLFLLPNAIWPDETSIPSEPDGNRFSLLCMRSVYTPEMGLDTLTSAYCLSKKQIPDMTLSIIGHIPPEIQPQVNELAGDPNVYFHDHVPHDELRRMIRASSVCVIPFKDVPDLAQTYPIKILEYFSLGKPVIASRIAGMSRLIDNKKNGLLFDPGNPSDLAEKIIVLYRQRKFCDLLAGNASTLDERFDCRRKAQLILRRLERLVPKDPKSTHFDG